MSRVLRSPLIWLAKKMGYFRGVLMVYLILLSCSFEASEAELPKAMIKILKKINRRGPYVGVLVPSIPLMQPLLQSSSYVPEDNPYGHIDYAGRRFHIGTFEHKKAILAATGKGMMNAAITTQIMTTLFSVKGILHYGLAGNTNKDQNVGDIAIPQFWAHTGLWNWQRYGNGPDDELPLEDDGDFTREYGYLNFGDFTNKTGEDDDSADNFLNNIWFQPEEIFDSEGGPDLKSAMFWIPVAQALFEFVKELEGMKLDECIDVSTCLSKSPRVMRVKRGSSASVYLDNVAYKDFLHSKFQVSIVDMESAAMALISHQEKVPFISFRALHDLAGEDDQSFGTQSNDQDKTFAPIHVKNLIHVLTRFIKYMYMDAPYNPNISSI